MAFQMVGMQFDETRKQVVALEILAMGRVALGNIGDLAIADQQRAVKDVILENDAGVGKHGLFCHCIVFQRLVPVSGKRL